MRLYTKSILKEGASMFKDIEGNARNGKIGGMQAREVIAKVKDILKKELGFKIVREIGSSHNIKDGNEYDVIRMVVGKSFEKFDQSVIPATVKTNDGDNDNLAGDFDDEWVDKLGDNAVSDPSVDEQGVDKGQMLVDFFESKGMEAHWDIQHRMLYLLDEFEDGKYVQIEITFSGQAYWTFWRHYENPDDETQFTTEEKALLVSEVAKCIELEGDENVSWDNERPTNPENIIDDFDGSELKRQWPALSLKDTSVAPGLFKVIRSTEGKKLKNNAGIKASKEWFWGDSKHKEDWAANNDVLDKYQEFVSGNKKALTKSYKKALKMIFGPAFDFDNYKTLESVVAFLYSGKFKPYTIIDQSKINRIREKAIHKTALKIKEFSEDDYNNFVELVKNPSKGVMNESTNSFLKMKDLYRRMMLY